MQRLLVSALVLLLALSQFCYGQDKVVVVPKQIAGAQTRMPTVFYTVEGSPKVERPQEDIDDITTYLMAMVEPPEVTLKAAEESKKAEEEKQVDWSNVQY